MGARWTQVPPRVPEVPTRAAQNGAHPVLPRGPNETPQSFVGGSQERAPTPRRHQRSRHTSHRLSELRRVDRGRNVRQPAQIPHAVRSSIDLRRHFHSCSPRWVPPHSRQHVTIVEGPSLRPCTDDGAVQAPPPPPPPVAVPPAGHDAFAELLQRVRQRGHRRGRPSGADDNAAATAFYDDSLDGAAGALGRGCRPAPANLGRGGGGEVPAPAIDLSVYSASSCP